MNTIISNKVNAAAQLAEAAGRIAVASPTLSNTTTHFAVFAMPTLGAGGLQVASAVTAGCESDYDQLSQWFGIQVPHFNVTLAPLSQFIDGTGGAFHEDGAGTDLYCDVKLNPTVDARVSLALMVAEAVEVFETLRNVGWDAGASNGKGLSRVLSAECHPKVLEALGGYTTAAIWLDDLRSDWVNLTNQTDCDPYAIGCAVLFLNWLHCQLKIGWKEICQAGGSTLAQTYQRVGGPQLTGENDGFVAFRKLLDRHFPLGKDCGLTTTDNPFPLH